MPASAPGISSAPRITARRSPSTTWARHEIRQAENSLRALAHHFDLRVPHRRTAQTGLHRGRRRLLRCEKRPSGSGADRILGDTPIAGADRALDVRDRRTWGVPRRGTARVARFDRLPNDTRFGRWSHATASKAAKQGEEVSLNELFAPTLCKRQIRERTVGADPLRGRPRRRDNRRRNRRHARDRALDGAARPARRRTVGLSARRRTLSLAAFHFTGDAETRGSPSVSRTAMRRRGSTASTTHASRPKRTVSR